MTSRLFDISHYNAYADFAVARAAGYEGVYLKATEGTFPADPTFAERKIAARAAGLKVGAYLFFHPAKDVQAQVANFVNVAGDCDLRPALDFEVTDGLDPAAAANAARTACALLVHHYGYAPVLYTYPSFGVNCAGLGGFLLWIADYSGAAAPRVPDEWNGDWALWQTGQEQVPGVAGGDGPGTDVSVCPNLQRLIVPPKTPPSKEKAEMNKDEWATLGKLLDAVSTKVITHIRNGPDYNLGTMQKEISDLKHEVAALKADPPAGGFGN